MKIKIKTNEIEKNIEKIKIKKSQVLLRLYKRQTAEKKRNKVQINYYQ